MAESNPPSIKALESQAAELHKTLDDLQEMARKGFPVSEAIEKSSAPKNGFSGAISIKGRIITMRLHVIIVGILIFGKRLPCDFFPES